jgi:hypothetical protein
MHMVHQIQGDLLMFAQPEDFIQFMRDAYGTEAANAWFQRLPSFLMEEDFTYRGATRCRAT